MGRKTSKQSLVGRDGTGTVRGRVSRFPNDSSLTASDDSPNTGVPSQRTSRTKNPTEVSDEAGGLAKGHEAVAKKYTPPDCKCCFNLRESQGNTRSYTEVYSVHRSTNYVTRYIRCRFCGATSKDMEKTN